MQNVTDDQTTQAAKSDEAAIPLKIALFFITGGGFAKSGGKTFLEQLKRRWLEKASLAKFYACAIDWDDMDSVDLMKAGFDCFNLDQAQQPIRDRMYDCLETHELPDDLKEKIKEQIAGGVAGTPRLVRILLEANEDRLKRQLWSQVGPLLSDNYTRFYFFICFSPCGPTGSTTALFLADNLPKWFDKWRKSSYASIPFFKLLSLMVIPDSWDYNCAVAGNNGATGYFSRETIESWWHQEVGERKPYGQKLLTFSGLDYNPEFPNKLYQPPMMDWLTQEFADTAALLLSGLDFVSPDRRIIDNTGFNNVEIDLDDFILNIPSPCHCIFAMVDYPEEADYRVILEAYQNKETWRNEEKLPRLRQALLSKWIRPPYTWQDLTPLNTWKSHPPNAPSVPDAPGNKPETNWWFWILWICALIFLLLSLAGSIWSLGLLSEIASTLRRLTPLDKTGWIIILLGILFCWLYWAKNHHDSHKELLDNWAELNKAYNDADGKNKEWTKTTESLENKIRKMLSDAKTRLETSMARDSVVFPLIRQMVPNPEKSFPEMVKPGTTLDTWDWFKRTDVQNFIRNCAQTNFYRLINGMYSMAVPFYFVPFVCRAEWANIFTENGELRKRFNNWQVREQAKPIPGWGMRLKWIVCFGPEVSHNLWEKYKEQGDLFKKSLESVANYDAYYGEKLKKTKDLLL